MLQQQLVAGEKLGFGAVLLNALADITLAGVAGYAAHERRKADLLKVTANAVKGSALRGWNQISGEANSIKSNAKAGDLSKFVVAEPKRNNATYAVGLGIGFLITYAIIKTKNS